MSYIEREAAIDGLDNIDWYHVNDFGRLLPGSTSDMETYVPFKAVEEMLKSISAADVRPAPDGGIGEMSDGYHTFNGLYYQRMVLFAALVKAHKDKAWKSRKHEDGELCFGGGWFIVGIDTPEGSYTYHYEEKDWDLFDCVELPVAKHWDGHTEKDVTRLLSLDVRPVVFCKDCRHRDPEDHKCDCGQLERAGCVFPVDDEYYCAYGEVRAWDTQKRS